MSQSQAPGRKRKWDQPAAPTNADAAIAAAQAAAANLTAKWAASQPGVRLGVAESFTADVEINNSPNRHLLTRRETHERIRNETGAVITTKGRYKQPGAPDPAPHERALYIHITADSAPALEKARKYVQEILDGSLASLYNTTPIAKPAKNQQVKCKVVVGIDNEPIFKVKQRLVGQKGAYLKYITSETGARVQIRGKSSGYLEPPFMQEAQEPLHMEISASSELSLQVARSLAEDLLETVLGDYRQWHEKFAGYQHQSQPAAYAYHNLGVQQSPRQHYQYVQQQQPAYQYQQQQQPPPPPPPSQQYGQTAAIPHNQYAPPPPPPGQYQQQQPQSAHMYGYYQQSS